MTVLPMRSEPSHTTHACHWSVPTLFMPSPYWLFAWETPWCCWNEHEIVVLSTTDGCAECPLWKPRDGPQDLKGALRPEGAVALLSGPTRRVRIGDGHGRHRPVE